MTATKYSYTKSVDSARLTQEIKENDSITVALDNVTCPLDGEVDVWFKGELSQAEKVELDLVVDRHVNTPLVQTATPQVEIANFQQTADNKVVVLSTPQPGFTDFILCSITDSTACHTGDLIHVNHTVFQYGEDQQGVEQPCGLFVDNGGPVFNQYWLNSKYIDYCTIMNRTFIIDGGIMWKINADNGNTGLVSLSVGVVNEVFDPTPFECTPGTGNAAIVDGYLLVPMPGLTGGTHNMPIGQVAAQTPQPFKMTEMTRVVMTQKFSEPAFWQIDFNKTTMQFSNLLPCADPYAEERNLDTGDPNIRRIVGNIFTVEIPLYNFVKDLLLIDSSHGFFSIGSQDATEIGYGIRLRLDCKTIIDGAYNNVPWSVVGFLKAYREHTV